MILQNPHFKEANSQLKLELYEKVVNDIKFHSNDMVLISCSFKLE